MFISSLNSGSNGNCYYVGNDAEAVLIDAGISCREVEKRLQRQGLDIARVKAVFISHEHTDHIRGLSVLARRYSLPVYATAATWKALNISLGEACLQVLSPHQEVAIGGLLIKAFPKHHDAADPLSFLVSGAGVSTGILTDIGRACPEVIEHFRRCHAVFLEANYDERMLEEGHYPYYLKQRIRSGSGHLSNREALELFMSHRAPFLSHLILSHLSKENNSPQLVQRLFEEQAGPVKVIVASREYETEVYTVTGASSSAHPEQAGGSFRETGVQMSLFTGQEEKQQLHTPFP